MVNILFCRLRSRRRQALGEICDGDRWVFGAHLGRLVSVMGEAGDASVTPPGPRIRLCGVSRGTGEAAVTVAETGTGSAGRGLRAASGAAPAWIADLGVLMRHACSCSPSQPSLSFHPLGRSPSLEL